MYIIPILYYNQSYINLYWVYTSLIFIWTIYSSEEEELHAPLETEDIISAVFKMLVLKATLKSIEIELFKVTIINACVT